MDVSLKPGKYIVAVSGGVDSMVLLDKLQALPGVELVVAHFDHGIRADSSIDCELVERAAERYKLPFIHERGNLGPLASEATARKARYGFLLRVQKEQNAKAIITAHHQDDLIETAIINILRGTGRKGLSALGSSPHLIRPLLHVTKQQIYRYALGKPDIIWREDSTNQSDKYLRNYVRQYIVQGLGPHGRQLLLRYIERAVVSNPIIDVILLHEINRHTKNGSLDRRWFIMLPYDVSCEMLTAWLRSQDIREFDKKTIERLVVALKVAEPGKRLDINAGYWLKVDKSTFSLTKPTIS